MKLGEFMALENIRDFLGRPSSLLVVRWSPGSGAVLTELPKVSRVAMESDSVALEAALRSRRKVA